MDLLWQRAPNFAFVLQDREGTIIGWRAAAAGIFGYVEEEVLGRKIDLLFTAEDRALGLPELERAVALSADRSEDDRWHVRKDGTRIWVCGSMIALRENGRHVGFAKVMCDRTNLRAQLETLENRLSRSHDALHGRDIFFSRLTHELRNAVAPISSAAQLLELKYAVHDDTAAQLGVVKRQLGHLKRMMDDLAEVVRSGAGKLKLEMREFDLSRDLTEIVAVVMPDVQRKAQTLVMHIPKEPILIVADKERVHQIVFNLLHNAIKYTPQHGHIWLQCSVEVDEAVIKVEDTGVGIAPSLLPVIFELFTQEVQQSDGGFGVGLSLVKDLVDAHHGFVEVRSDGKDRGSEFTVRLPLAAPDSGDRTSPAS